MQKKRASVSAGYTLALFLFSIQGYTVSMFDNINLLIFVTSLAVLWLGIIIYRSAPTERANRIYSVNVLFVLLWIYTMMAYRASGESTKIISVILLYLAPIWIPSTLLHFTYLFPVQEKISKVKLVLIYGLSLCLFVFVLIPGFIIKDVLIIPNEEKIIVWGPAYFTYAFYQIFFFSYAFWRLSSQYRKGTAIIKRQVVAVLFGYNIGANLALVTNVVLPWVGNFRYNWVGQLFSLIMVAGTAYAITQHKMFNVRLIATEAFAFAISFALLFNIFIPAPFIFQVLKTALFLAISFAGYLLVRSVFREIRQKEELAKLSEQLEDANEQLKRLDETKSEFVSIASHQLRTPLTVIKGYISMLEEGSFGKIPVKQQSPLEKIFESSNRLIELVENLLSVSRIESGRMKYNFEPTQFEDLAASVVEEMKPAADKKKLKLTYVAPSAPLPKINIDAEKLRQVMMNLVDNAVKYSKEGWVRVETKLDDGKNNSNVTKPSIVFAVTDSGLGVRLEDQKRLFQKFIRGQGSALVHTQGTGLGLYVGRIMVEAHNGNIWVESQGEGKGSTFAFSIPLPPKTDQAVLALKDMLDYD